MKIAKYEIDNKILVYGASIAGGIAFVYFLATFVVSKSLVSLTKAAPATRVSLVDSYAIGQKILARADGKDKCIVNVFVLDKVGHPVSGKQVSLSGNGTIDALNPLTDMNGKAGFEITTTKEGQNEMEASVEGMTLSKTVTCTFRADGF